MTSRGRVMRSLSTICRAASALALLADRGLSPAKRPWYLLSGGLPTSWVDSSPASVPVFRSTMNTAPFWSASPRRFPTPHRAPAGSSINASAQELAEIDRAKTVFFSNVSHEFRTPLTLMLGPIEAALARPPHTEEERQEFELLHRNAMRLLKLVNALLDFSRIEAGESAQFEPTDLAELTRDVASSFRAAFQRAGLDFVVDCPDLGEAVYVDQELWEKIVLNLLSNAFKFTLEGSVRVLIRRDGQHALLQVTDTGVGVPEKELPRLFERFHRVDNTRARTHKIYGIGLALVLELVTLHGGTIEAASQEGSGTTFTVRVPLGHDHLAPERIVGRTGERRGHPHPRLCRGSAALVARRHARQAKGSTRPER